MSGYHEKGPERHPRSGTREGQNRDHRRCQEPGGVCIITLRPQLIFAIIVNNYTCKTKILKKKLEQIMLSMTEV